MNSLAFDLCACLGPQGNDPVCPCQMQQQGLVPSNQWTEDDKKELHRALSQVFERNQHD